jgi:hypothetical protein
MAKKKSETEKKPVQKKVKKHIERGEDRRKGERRKKNIKVTKVKKNNNVFSVSSFLLAIIAMISVILISYIGDDTSKKIQTELNKVSDIISDVDVDIDRIEDRITTNQEQISAISDLSTENGLMIESIAEAVSDNHNRIITAQKGVNRLVRAKLIEYGYNDSLSLAISNEISVNPTIAKWDTLIDNSLFNFEKLNERIDKLNYDKSSVNSSDIESVNKKVEELEDLLLKKHKLVLKLLRKHGSKSMKKVLKNK